MHRNSSYRDFVYVKIDPDRTDLATIQDTLRKKQDRLEELQQENQQYPSEQTERQIAKLNEIIARLQNTIIVEKERGKR